MMGTISGTQKSGYVKWTADTVDSLFYLLKYLIPQINHFVLNSKNKNHEHKFF